MLNDIDIFVLATKKRNPLITSYLDKNNIKYELYYTPDYDLDLNKVKYREYSYSLGNLTAASRLYKGTADVLKKINKQYGLIFEDDAVPNCDNWIEIVNNCIKFCDDFDLVSLHARGVKQHFFESIANINGRNILKPKTYEFWVSQMCGSMAFLINKNKINCYVDHEFNGIPVDVSIYSKKFVLLEPSIFNHDNGQPSTLN